MVVPPRGCPKADHYKALGVQQDATLEEVKAAFRKLARECHPDKNQGKAGAEDEFKLLMVAYEVLSSPRQRREYDLMRGVWRREAKGPAGKSSFRESCSMGCSSMSFNRSLSRDAYDELISARQKRAEALQKRRTLSKQFSCVGGRLSDAEKMFWTHKSEESKKASPLHFSKKKTATPPGPPPDRTPLKKIQKAQKKAAARVRSASISPSNIRSPTRLNQWRSFSNMTLPPSYTP
eukprot:TRINITY_DN6178_c1_g1_i1.p1 TRINITY_DN6178_c1_g1~~TRINITY_DN6178_c1_g1_i1.p1  ORF type:complete len:235 (+),score=24.13 TRINITY_DN6178_c1_g1_i1:36-740(+)